MSFFKRFQKLFSLQTLSAKLTFYTGVGLFVVTTLIGVATYFFLSQSLYQGLKDKYQAMADQLAAVTVDAILLKDYAVIERYAQQIVQKSPEMSALIITGEHGEPLAEVGKWRNHSRGYFSLSVPIELAGRNIGRVAMQVSTRPVQKTLAQLLLIELMGLMVIFIFQFWLIRKILNRQLVAPITELAENLQDVETAILEPLKTSTHNSKEVQIISDKLVEFQKALQDHMRSLEEAHTYTQQATQRLCQDQRMASIGQMAAGLAHNLNTPLANILGYCQMAQESLADEEIEVVEQALAVIERQTQSCAQMVKNLLSAARAPEVVVGPVKVVELLEQTVALMKPVMRSKGVNEIALQVRVEAEQQVLANIASLEQVLFNLINNASQAHATRIQISATQDVQWVEVRVEDNGEGISESQKAHLFEAFYTSKAVGKGTGLGLYLAKTLMQTMEGDLTLMTSHSGCTQFQLKLRKC